MVRKTFIGLTISIFFTLMYDVYAADFDLIFQSIQSEVSGNRARDYVMRLWQYDKWTTLPGWKKAIQEAQTIMKERGFDEAVIYETPADGRTMSGAWTNPIGWDVKQATLEVIEPSDLPDEFRYLCNYQDNPTSLNAWSAPTPPEGIETELVLMETNDPAELERINAEGKIVLTSLYTRGIKRYLDKYGILGYVSDNIESPNEDFVTANQWLNGWSDIPGGWWMTDYDSKKNFCFSISREKAEYLRSLLRQGKKVIVRARIDSRYYTNDTLPYVVGLVKGTGSEGEEILITGHMNEWGANDNSAGSSAILEAVGTLNDLIRSGKLPRPKRSIRVLLGAEMYGSLPYVQRFLDRLQTKTIAAVCCDTGAQDYDLHTTTVNIHTNPNVCPTFTDAVFPEIARMYYTRYASNRNWKAGPYSMGTDTYFCDPMIGVPTNWIYMNEGGHLHHNSMDTIDQVDPRSLRELSFINVAYLYYIANAGFEEVPWIAELTYNRGIQVILEKALQAHENLMSAKDQVSLGKALSEGLVRIEYYTELQKKALDSIQRLVSLDIKNETRASMAPYARSLDEFRTSMTKQLRDIAEIQAKNSSIRIVIPQKQTGSWEKQAAAIIPRRKYFGTLFLAEIPVEEWQEVNSSPHWWSATNWASASYWWCDGKRNLNEIKELVELEAGVPVRNFDLINYYTFLKKYGFVEFVSSSK
ncbi:MAG TPA: M28 family peptidase [Anaerolineae bacterium]|nr:M28 family peptidase [Anaerolineae bacterium]